MKKFATLVASGMAALVFVVGCQNTSVEGPGGKKLTVVKPTDQTIQRGATNPVMVTVTRDNFKDAIDVKFDNLPKGVEVVEKDKKVPTNENVATYTLRANEDAGLVTNHEVKVTVTGPDGMKATESFRLTVKEKS